MSQTDIQLILDRLDQLDSRMDTFGERLDSVEKHMVTRSDVFQAVLTVHGFSFAAIIGTVVVLNAVGAFA